MEQNELTSGNGLTLLHDPNEGQLLILALMSGGGTNLEKILEKQKELEQIHGKDKALYRIVGIFADTPDCRANEIRKANNLPVAIIDIDEFYRARGRKDRRDDPDKTIRCEFDERLIEATKGWGAKAAAYAGYMSVASPVLVDAYLGINVHPGDLTVIDERTGKKKYAGGGHVPSMKAIRAGETQVRGTTHLIEKELDGGRILMQSAALDIPFPENFDMNDEEALIALAKECQNTLKVMGDWEIFPRTLQYIAEGRYAQDANGNIFFRGNSSFIPAPKGIKFGDTSYSMYET